MARAPDSDEPERPNNYWEEFLRKMLPDGAPLPDEDQLDFSISIDYVGPSPYFQTPPINPIIPKTSFAALPKQPASLTPRNPAWLKSRSSSETADSNIKQFSFDSISFDHATSDDYGDIHYDQDNCSRPDQMQMERRSSALNRSMNKSKGFCNRCGNGRSRLLFTCREQCLVCGAEYCRKCILKAMGTMPEGRKCIGCIGSAIDEAKRGKLGKISRMLGWVCSRLEIKRIMQVERECKANQVRPEQFVVNGRELSEDELDALLGCTLPPTRLKPGRYWYDKVSGLWGKEGEKPDRIISSKLDVRGKLQTTASSGNTRVYVNGREITNVELRVLKLAKVQCTRGTHFWLYEDGSYEEEGQNKIKGNIWEKASVRFICSMFSLPVPPQNASSTKEVSTLCSSRLLSKHLEQHMVHKLLLLGLEDSNTSSIFKQASAKFIHSNKFTTEELQSIKLIIQSNTYRYLSTLLEGRDHFEEEEAWIEKESADRCLPGKLECDESKECIYSVSQKISDFSDWLLDIIATGDRDACIPAAVCEYAPLVDEIWKDPAIQETYKRREELHFVPDVAKYYLDRLIEISSNEYEPLEKDILFAEGLTPSNGLTFMEFSFDDHSVVSEIHNQHFEDKQPLSKYRLIYLSPKLLYDGCKWLEMLEGMNIVVFCVSLIDYDQIWTYTTTSTCLRQNKMLASRNLFENIARHSCFKGTPFLLLLTKYDLFEGKVDQVPITVCDWFRDFSPLKISNSKNLSMAHQAFYYIAVKFKKVYKSITGRKLYVRQVRALDRTSVDEAFRYVREVIDWEDVKDENIYAVSDGDVVSGAETYYISM
ncbi:hypothetical protein OROGR_004705 [Orobanche gracilis]